MKPVKPSHTDPPSPAARPGPDLLGPLLRDVSRTFYRTLHILPTPVRRPIGLGYLLARATDTLADTTLVPVATRLQALEDLRQRIDGTRSERLNFRALNLGNAPASRASAAERQLLLRIEEAIGVLQSLSLEDRTAVRDVLHTITSGQVLDLQRFGEATRDRIVALTSAEELHDYTYRVAGCVGGFWTRLCERHLFPETWAGGGALLGDGIRFGRGLQLVNILRDLPRDLDQGRCYLPADELAEAHLQAADLLNPSNELRLRPVYNRWLDAADAHLLAGWRYTCHLPFNQWRLRLGCAWPVLIGVQTTAKLRTAHVLDARQRIKISRRDVRKILLGTLWRLPFPGAWKRLGPPLVHP